MNVPLSTDENQRTNIVPATGNLYRVKSRSHSGDAADERRVPNVLTVDVEEYFHPTEIRRSITEDQWPVLPSRLDRQLEMILDLFDENDVKATFFILGWVAMRQPNLVRAIVQRGHDLGCHSYAHRLVYDQTPAEFREDTIRAASIIGDVCGIKPRAYRAPSYSITRKSLWALEILIECGFTHDSSIYPISHDRYGIAGFERHPHMLYTPSGPITEIPIATVKLANGHVAPVGGGGYLRLLPYRYTAAGIRRINNAEQKSACVYFHPWEIDPGQPQLTTSLVARIRTYSGLKAMRGKIGRLLSEFCFTALTSVEFGSSRPRNT